jgi:hypothetical protein
MLRARRARYGMTHEVRGVYDTNNKARIDPSLWPEHQQFGRANAGVFGKNRLIEVRAQLAIEHITGLESVLGALDVASPSLAAPDKATWRDVFQPYIDLIWSIRRVNLGADKITKVG